MDNPALGRPYFRFAHPQQLALYDVLGALL
jgi:hypothetical protein